MNLEDLIAWSRTYVMTPEEREEQRRDFAYWNVKLHNENVTREMVDAAAEKIARESSVSLGPKEKSE